MATAEAVTTPALVLSDDGQRLAGRFGLNREQINPYLHVWDTTNGQELSVLPGLKGLLQKIATPAGPIQKMAFQADSSLVSLSDTGELTLWNTKQGREIHRELIPRENVNKAAISSEGRVVFFDEGDDLIDVDLKTGKRSTRYPMSRWVYGTPLSPDPNLFVTTYLAASVSGPSRRRPPPRSKSPRIGCPTWPSPGMANGCSWPIRRRCRSGMSLPKPKSAN